MIKNNNSLIGKDKIKVIGNNEFISNDQIFSCIDKKIKIEKKDEEYIVMAGESLMGDLLLINFINCRYQKHKYITIPIYYDPNHWYLVILDLEKNTSTIYDSILKQFNDKQYVHTFKRIYKLIQLINISNKNNDIDISNHQFFISSNAPQQPLNSVDCGAYVFLYFLFKLNNENYFDEHSNYKRFLMNEILALDFEIVNREIKNAAKLKLEECHLKNLKWRRQITIYGSNFD